MGAIDKITADIYCYHLWEHDRSETKPPKLVVCQIDREKIITNFWGLRKCETEKKKNSN